MSTTSQLGVLKGVQEPRVSCWPGYTSSAGREALDLARSVGLWLDPWQALVLDHALGERHDGKWSAFEVALIVSRQNGKGAVLEARELAGLFLFGEKLILHSAHEFKTAQEAFRRVLGWIESKDHLRKRVKRIRTSHGEEGIELIDGARLRFVARSTGSGRGFSGDCVILDEAYNLGGDAMAALLPTLSARPNPQLWYASSAGMETSEQLLRVHERGVKGHAGEDVGRLCYCEWSADPELPIAGVEAVLQSNPAIGYRISLEFVDSERNALPEWEYCRERLGYWPEFGTEQVIDPKVWASLADPESDMVGAPVFAADCNPERTRSAICAVGTRADGLPGLEVIDERPGTSWVPERYAELRRKWEPPCELILDPAGPAGGWIGALADLGIDPLLLNSREMAQACGAFYETAQERQAMRWRVSEHSPALTSALSGAKKRPLGDAWAWHRRDSLTNIAPLVAATEGLHGWVLYGGASDALDNIW